MTHKICFKCDVRKPLESFVKNRNFKNGLENRCKPCRNKSLLEYRRINRWRYSYYLAKRRCRCETNNKFKYYGGRGIKLLMDANDFRFLWERDNGHEMKVPTIDRIDPDGHYEISNCRFIEKSENSKREAADQKRQKNGRFLSRI